MKMSPTGEDKGTKVSWTAEHYLQLAVYWLKHKTHDGSVAPNDTMEELFARLTFDDSDAAD